MEINVVYLAYFNEALGYNINVVEKFFDSYREKKAGIQHSLTIIVKNCTVQNSLKKIQHIASEFNAKIIELPDDGWDFGAYFRAAKIIDSELCFFCGGYVQILTDNWLSKFYNAFKQDNSVKLVGAMGSWGDSKQERFPNYHIRTTAFMIDRKLILDYANSHKFPETKEDTYEIEHGKTSLTNFILTKGYKAVVVNSDGKVFFPEDWIESKTFRCPERPKSMFADRHTAMYDISDDNHREFLERNSWGRSLKNTRLKIFVATNNKDEPFFASEVFQPIYNNSNSMTNWAYGLMDNCFDNISEKSCYYGELTGHYWVWKNLLHKLDTEYVGFFHFNRFLDFNISNTNNIPFNETNIFEFKNLFEKYTEENMINCIKQYDIIVPQKFVSPKNIYELYLDSSPKEEFDLAVNILKSTYPEYADSSEEILYGNELYACLIFIMRKELIEKYMEWIFSIFNKLEKQIDLNKYSQSIDNQVFVNIAEIFFNIWLNNEIKTSSSRVLETTSVYINTNAY